MAIAHVQTRSATGSSPVSISAFSTPIASGELVVVKASTEDEVNTLTMSDNGGTPMTWGTAIGPIDHSAGGVVIRTYLFWAVGNDTGATTVTATGTNAHVIASRFTFSSSTIVVNGTPVSGESTNVTSHNVSGTVTTTVAEALLVCGARANAARTFAAGTDYTIPSNGTTVRSMLQYRIVSATGSYDAPFTSTSTSLVAVLAAFAVDPGGGPGPTGFGRLLGHERNRLVRTF